MRDFITLGSTPAYEPCAQVGEPDYDEKAREECQRFITLLRKTFGDEPPGARFGIKSFPHDFGHYLEVVCYFDTEDAEASRYAFRCEDELPATWEE